MLTLHAGRPVSVDRLVDELWSGEPPGGAETTLRSYVSRLRSVLGAEAPIRGGSDGYAIEVRPDSVDSHRFEHLVRTGEAAIADRKIRKARDALVNALSLWRGRPFGELATDGMLRIEAERLDELRLHAVELRIETDLQLAAGAEIVDELQGLVRTHPYRERFWRQLMLALYTAGRQADALGAYQQARNQFADELGLEPSPELEQLQLAILRHEVPTPAAPDERHNVPAALTDFIGRTDDLNRVSGLLASYRLVTLTGVGGVGKTRLALEAARRSVTEFRDGVWFADLASISDASLLAGHVAAAVDMREQLGENTNQQLARRLRERNMLLVLDNCEHLSDAAAHLVAAIVETAENVQILATSRAALGVPGEIEYPVQPLGLPPDPTDVDAVRASEAVAMFVNRAQIARPARAMDDASLIEAARICVALDGLPLAMELAAARASALSLPDIAARLHDRLKFLVSWRRLAPARHRTMREALDWSYDLLAEEERWLLARLSVFAADFTLEAASKICADSDQVDVVDALEGLVRASLVGARDGAGGMRYQLLDVVREYAAERLEGLAETNERHRAHARYYLRLVRTANLGVTSIGRAPQNPRLVEREEANVRAALDWAQRHDVGLGLRLAVALENFWVTRDPSEAERWLGALLARADGVDPLLRALATRDHGSMAHVLGRFDDARSRYLRSRELFASVGNTRGVAELTYRLGIIARRQRDYVTARKQHDESLAVFLRLGDRVGQVQVVSHIALIEFETGNLARGFELIDQSLELTREIGWAWWEIQVLGIAARWLLDTGHIEKGEQYAREALQLASALGHRSDEVRALVLMAWAATARGEVDRAAVLWTAAQAETATIPIAAWGAGWATVAPLLDVVTNSSPALTLAEAVRYALDGAGR